MNDEQPTAKPIAPNKGNCSTPIEPRLIRRSGTGSREARLRGLKRIFIPTKPN